MTGISGFIAKHCALELLNSGYAVRGTVRNKTKADETRATLAKHCDITNLSFVETDLLSDDGWEEAMDGIDGVLHIASPFVTKEPKNRDEIMLPAVEGTLRVMRYAVAAGVPRFIQTSSTVAVVSRFCKGNNCVFNANDWPDTSKNTMTTYALSKILAEKTARDFASKHKGALHFSTINPGFVLGPLLDQDINTSAEVILMLMRGKYPAVPNVYFSVVDVRDVARLHRMVLETNQPSGGRFLAVSEVVPILAIAEAIRNALGEKARRLPRRQLPNWMVRLMAIFDPQVRSIVHELGFKYEVDTTETRKGLQYGHFIPLSESAPAMAISLEKLGIT